MITSTQLRGAALLTATIACAVSEVAAQVCDNVAGEVYSTTFDVEREAGDVRYVRRAVLRNNAEDDYILEFTARRIDLPDLTERWTVTFENDAAFDYVRHLEIDGTWVHSFESWTEGGVRHVRLSVPGAIAVITPNDEPGSPNFEAFLTLVGRTAARRGVVSVVVEEFPHWHFPPLGCVSDCMTNVEMCGHPNDCAPPYTPTACDCWASYECCMSDFLGWHLCAENCVCAFCYDGFVEECCAQMDATQAAVQFQCEQTFLRCLAKPNLQPCVQQ